MRIKFKLFASLSGYLPPGAKAHTVDIDLDDNSSPYQIIERFGVPKEMTHLVLLNGVYLDVGERGRWLGFLHGRVFGAGHPTHRRRSRTAGRPEYGRLSQGATPR